MELQGERLIPASVDATWDALNDPAFLKGCIANCESLERTEPDTLAAVVAMKVGPVSARFKGKLMLTNVQAPNSYTIVFEGQGGIAGFGKGSADVALTPAGEGQTTLKYLAKATVGGKIAQIGSRLIDSAASKITEEFFAAFLTQMEARNAAQAGGHTTEFGTSAGPGGLGDGAGPGAVLGGTAEEPGRGSAGGTPGTPGNPNFRIADLPTAATTGGVPALAGPAADAAPAAMFPARAAAGASSARSPALDPAVTKTWMLIGALVAVGAIYFSIR